MSSPDFPAAVLFDHDGTLVNSEPQWAVAKRAVAERYGQAALEPGGLVTDPIEAISLIEIPNAPSPANPTTGVSGQPIFAPMIAGKP